MAVRKMPSPHTANNVRKLVEAVLAEWTIPLSKVLVVVTDNGSNMTAAFKQQQADMRDPESGDDKDDEKEDQEIDEDEF